MKYERYKGWARYNIPGVWHSLLGSSAHDSGQNMFIRTRKQCTISLEIQFSDKFCSVVYHKILKLFNSEKRIRYKMENF